MAPPATVWFTHVYLPSVYAGDLAEAMVRMLEVPASAGKIYNVAGNPGASTWWDHYRAWRQAGGPRRFVVPVPVPVQIALDTLPAQLELGWRTRPLVEGFQDMRALERGERPAHQAA